MIPRSLLQLHFHCRAGGVTTVMHAYAQAFLRITGSKAGCAVACGAAGASPLPRGVTLLPLAEADYHEFRSAGRLAAASRRLQRRLRLLLQSAGLPAPVCVVAHNLNLARNVALADAFSSLSRQLGGCSYRFFLVVHDRAEEGRVRQMRHIRQLARARVAVWDMLYPPVAYVTPSRRSWRVLKSAGAPVRYLPDPLSVPRHRPSGAAVSRRFRRACAEAAREQGIYFDAARPLLLYPARLIRRKNPVEACIVACLIMGATLLLGADGTAAEDRALGRLLRAQCRRLRLGLICDAGTVLRRMQEAGMLCTRPFMSLCGLADGCISTSVIEGFGYALYEPWLYGRGVIGRMPEGFSAAGGIRVPQLYDAMLLPAAWIDSNSDARRRPRRWPAGVVRDGCVDFACLDFRTQCGILCRLARQPEDLRCIAFLKGKAVTPLAPAAAGGRLIARNAARIRAKLGEQAFTAGFGKCFLGSGVLPQGSIITHAALRRAGDERFWRLLGGGREDV